MSKAVIVRLIFVTSSLLVVIEGQQMYYSVAQNAININATDLQQGLQKATTITNDSSNNETQIQPDKD
jgi:hypothetical protein